MAIPVCILCSQRYDLLSIDVLEGGYVCVACLDAVIVAQFLASED